jgi:hypothetical protein
MNKFFKFLLWFIPIPVIVISVNYIIDPANLFNKEYEKGIANYLVDGYNVTDVVNYNERLLQKDFIKKMKDCPEVLALGSSRVMLINSKILNEKKFINNGVSGASIEDDLAIYYLYEKRGCKIKKVILGVDPWLLNDNNEQIRWKENQHEFFDFSNLKLKLNLNHPIEQYDYTKYNELISSSYFQNSVYFFLKRFGKSYSPTKLIKNKGFTRLIDGSINYDEAYRNVSLSEIDKKASICANSQPIYSLGNFINISENKKYIFSTFIEYLQKQNIEVEFFLSPYHPLVYDYFKKDKYYHIVFKCEKYYREFAKIHNIKVFGAYDPGKLNFDNSYFFDGLHCNEKAIQNILN